MAAQVTDIEQLEATLRRELEETPLFKNWQSVITTIALLKGVELKAPSNGNGDAQTAKNAAINEKNLNSGSDLKIPTSFDQATNWEEKFLYVMNTIKEGTRMDVVNEWRKHGTTNSERVLLKAASITATRLEGKKYIKKERLEDGRVNYILKKIPPANAGG